MANSNSDRQWQRIRASVSAALAPMAVLALVVATPEGSSAASEKKDITALEAIIRDEFARKAQETPTPRPDAVKVFQWSPVVNGLASRLEYAKVGGYAGYTVFLRLENRANIPLRVPMGNPSDKNKDRIFELYSRDDEGDWQRTPWLPGELPEAPGAAGKVVSGGIIHDCVESGNNSTRPYTALQPGKSALVYLCGNPFLEKKATEIKVRMILEKSKDHELWHGDMESAPLLAVATQGQFVKHKGALDAPDHFPLWNRISYMGGDSSNLGSEYVGLHNTNSAILESMDLYRPEQMRPILERMMAREQSVDMKLMIARKAVSVGSESSAQFIAQCLVETDFATALSTHSLLRRLLFHYQDRTPLWLLEMVLVALRDERDAVGSPHQLQHISHGSIAELANRFGHLITMLGEVGCDAAVPYLIDTVKSGKEAATAAHSLGQIGDLQAVPVLIEALERSAENHEESVAGWNAEKLFREAMIGLGKLRATTAVPVLLKHLRHREAIEALDHIGDVRAVPALQQLVDNKGTVDADVEKDSPETAMGRLILARIALASLEQDQKVRTQRLLDLIDDPAFDEYDRRTVVDRLADRPELSAIPHLLNLARNDSSGAVVFASITGMRAFKHRDTISGLIECFDIDFKGSTGPKNSYVPERLRTCVAESLQAITGQAFGPDKAVWAKWWETEGRHQEWGWEVKTNK